MAKRVAARPEWLRAERVTDVYSVSRCISDGFADYVGSWRHSGYWLFDSPEVIRQLARDHALDLAGTALFFYEVHELEFDEDDARWTPYAPEPSLPTRVVPPAARTWRATTSSRSACGPVPSARRCRAMPWRPRSRGTRIACCRRSSGPSVADRGTLRPHRARALPDLRGVRGEVALSDGGRLRPRSPVATLAPSEDDERRSRRSRHFVARDSAREVPHGCEALRGS
jgi:hypothetical protein